MGPVHAISAVRKVALGQVCLPVTIFTVRYAKWHWVRCVSLSLSSQCGTQSGTGSDVSPCHYLPSAVRKVALGQVCLPVTIITVRYAKWHWVRCVSLSLSSQCGTQSGTGSGVPPCHYLPTNASYSPCTCCWHEKIKQASPGHFQTAVFCRKSGNVGQQSRPTSALSRQGGGV